MNEQKKAMQPIFISILIPETDGSMTLGADACVPRAQLAQAVVAGALAGNTAGEDTEMTILKSFQDATIKFDKDGVADFRFVEGQTVVFAVSEEKRDLRVAELQKKH